MIDYWNHRYARGGTSGAGSRGRLADYKARFLNDLLRGCSSVFDLGCGDGNLASLLRVRGYVGTDISEEAVKRCRKAAADKRFVDFEENIEADAAMSIDVLQHLVDDGDYQAHMSRLFSSARKLAIIYAPCTDVQPPRCAPHVRFRDFSQDVPWGMIYHEANPYAFNGDPQEESYSEFYVYAP